METSWSLFQGGVITHYVMLLSKGSLCQKHDLRTHLLRFITRTGTVAARQHELGKAATALASQQAGFGEMRS